jgi:hypothetical protein
MHITGKKIINKYHVIDPNGLLDLGQEKVETDSLNCLHIEVVYLFL